MIRQRVTSLVRRLATAPAFDRLWTPLTRGSFSILMLHRFEDPRVGSPGFPVATLARQLALLRRRGFEVLALNEALRLLARREHVERAVVLTVDDGYRDFFDLALPVFAATSTPVTVFLTSGFLDGTIWMWWDRVARVFEDTTASAVQATIGGRAIDERWSDPLEKRRVAERVVDWLKTLPEDAKEEAIVELAAALRVSLPRRPPEGCQPMTWEMVREAGRHGVSFGPHTVTHPILSRCSDQRARSEIEGSWDRLKTEAPNAAIPVFCYPNGRAEDQGAREIALFPELGLEAAVTTRPGRVRLGTVASRQQFLLPRFGHPKSDERLLQLASGLARG